MADRPELDDWHERSGRLLDEIDAAADRAIADLHPTMAIAGMGSMFVDQSPYKGEYGHITPAASQELAEMDAECLNT